VNASVRVFGLRTHLEAVVNGESADPYPRLPIPLVDPQEIRDRVEKWQTDVLSPSLPQADNQSSGSNQPLHVDDTERPPPLNFPTVKRRRSDVVRTIKCRQNSSRKDLSTSRYFRGVIDPNFPQGADRDNEGVTPTCSLPRASDVAPMPCPQVVALDDDPKRPPRPSPTPPGPENIREVSEVRWIRVTILSLVLMIS
jgi:hypothetical protein